MFEISNTIIEQSAKLAHSQLFVFLVAISYHTKKNISRNDHSLSFVVIPSHLLYHSTSLAVICCIPLVVCCCTTPCHSMYHSSVFLQTIIFWKVNNIIPVTVSKMFFIKKCSANFGESLRQRRIQKPAKHLRWRSLWQYLRAVNYCLIKRCGRVV